MRKRIILATVMFAFICVAGDPVRGQGSASQQLSKWLKRFPQADANKDGVLSPAEARAFRAQFITNQKRRTKDVAPAPTHEDVRYGPWDRNLLDVWVPESNRPVPLLVYIHGGGFIGGNKEQVRGSGNVQQALDRDVAFASLQYRFRYPDNGDTSDPQRAGIQDILRDSARAIQFLRYRAEDFNLDPTRIACYGGSAGAGTSIWLAFHDDLADPSSPDPVLRESSRISAAGMLNGQFTYDLEQWDTEFASRGGNIAKTHGRDGELELHKFFGLDREAYDGPLGRKLRADCDMRSLISSDDPPVYILTGNPDRPCTNRGIYNHHPLHASLVQQRCQECGVGVVCLTPKTRTEDAKTLEENPDIMLDFFFQHLDVEKAESASAPGVDRQRDSSALPIADPSFVGMDAEKLNGVKPRLQEFVDQKKVAGAVIAVARRGKLVLLEAVGSADIDAEEPMRSDTIFRIYSMTKPITSVAAMKLVEENKLRLDDPVSKYIPSFANARVFRSKSGERIETEPLRRAVTIRDLMRHTSGLTYGFFGNSPVEKMYREADVLSDDDDSAMLAEKVAAIPLVDQPGTTFRYSVSVDVLGRIVEIVSGRTLDVYFEEEIFGPLKMYDTGFFIPEDARSRFATSYAAGDDGGLEVSDAPATSRFIQRPKMLSGGGGLVSTAGDYLRFAQMLLSGGKLGETRILRPESVEMMTSNQLPTKALPISVGNFSVPGVGFGLGFSVVVEQQNSAGTGIVGDYGWDGMASTHFWVSPRDELAVVLLSQRVPFSAQLEDAIKPMIHDAIIDNRVIADKAAANQR